MGKKYTTEEMHARIEAAHPDTRGEWMVCHEVPDSTGHQASRRADAVAMNLWPSRMALHGYEIKVSRSDWLRELKRPDKAELVWRFCDYWWLVVSDQSIVKEGELPEGWGLMVPHGKGLRRIVQAKHVPAESPSFEFMASMLRAGMAGKVDRTAIAGEVQKARDDGYEQGVRDGSRQGRDAIRENERIMELFKGFSEATGIEVDRMDSGQHVGGAYNAAKRLLASWGEGAVRGRLHCMRRAMKNLQEQINEADAALESFGDEMDQLTPPIVENP